MFRELTISMQWLCISISSRIYILRSPWHCRMSCSIIWFVSLIVKLREIAWTLVPGPLVAWQPGWFYIPRSGSTSWCEEVPGWRTGVSWIRSLGPLTHCVLACLAVTVGCLQSWELPPIAWDDLCAPPCPNLPWNFALQLPAMYPKHWSPIKTDSCRSPLGKRPT